MDAMTLGGVPGWLDLPPDVGRVVDAIPPLLWPELGTVVGTMVREREISWLDRLIAGEQDSAQAPRSEPHSQEGFTP